MPTEESRIEALLSELAEAKAQAARAERDRAVLRYVIANVPHSIFWKDKDGVFLGANENLLRDVSFERLEDLVGKTDYDLPNVTREEVEYFRSVDREVMRDGVPRLNFEETQERADGRHWLLTSKVPYRDARGEIIGILGIYVDITERKRLEEQLVAAKEAAEAAARAKSMFLATVSHELRTPLTLILAPLEDLLAQPGMTAGERRALERVRRNAERLTVLVNDLLDVAKLETGRQELRVAPLDVEALLATTVDDVTAEARARGIALSYAGARAPVLMAADRFRLEQIVLNLVGNALKFTPAGGRVEVSLHATGDEIAIHVADTGPGIPAGERQRIFQRFEQLDASATRRHEGAGLGLAIVRGLVELMGGSVHVEDNVGQGSRFVVRLPRRAELLPQAAGARPPHEERASREALSARLPAHVDGEAARGAREGTREGTRVLIADDNADMRAFMAEVLGDDFVVETARDGAEALERIRSDAPDVVVCDVMMPEVDGLEVARRMKADPLLRAVPIVVVTARAGRDELVSALDAGADDYLAKPFSAAELRARVRAAARLRGVYRDLEKKHAELLSAYEWLERAQLQMLKSEKLAALGTFIGGISHELRNPMATILLQAQRLLRTVDDETSPLYRGLSTIEQQTMRCRDLLGVLLEYARARPGAKARVSPAHLAERVGALARTQEKGAGVTIELPPPPPDLPEVEVSEHEMEVALLNIVGNALDATAKGGRVTLSLRERSVDGQPGVEIAVADTGTGIAPELRERIFDPFFTTKPPGKGTGLGLSLAQRIVHNAGGVIGVDSTWGRGTTMRVWLPAASEAAAHDDVRAGAIPERGRSGGASSSGAAP